MHEDFHWHVTIQDAADQVVCSFEHQPRPRILDHTNPVHKVTFSDVVPFD